MMLLYNIGIAIFVAVAKFASLFNSKAKLWVTGRRGIFKQIASMIQPGDRIIWIHSASLGEFEQGRPIIEQIRKEHPEYKILLTFFSPSGYEIRKDYKGVDYIAYLPADTPSNARRFVKIARPEIAVIIKYEFWLNTLSELASSGCRTFVVSAIFRQNSVFFKWYGGEFRKALMGFERIFVQNEQSKKLLVRIGVDRVTVAGDTRFDRVAAIAQTAPKVDIVERFAGSGKVFIAGSTWLPDEQILLPLIKNHQDVKFIIAPHEMDQARIDRFVSDCGNAIRYTKCDATTDLSLCRVLIIDTIGILSSVYRYARYAYIGGGFGVGIHNTLEAATFGLPMAFGPNYAKFKEARDMIEIGSARSINGETELEEWFSSIDTNRELYEKLHRATENYVKQNIGATDIILKTLFG